MSRSANKLSRFFPMNELKYVLTDFSVENERLVTGQYHRSILGS